MLVSQISGNTLIERRKRLTKQQNRIHGMFVKLHSCSKSTNDATLKLSVTNQRPTRDEKEPRTAKLNMGNVSIRH